jgi:hypothetical protein
MLMENSLEVQARGGPTWMELPRGVSVRDCKPERISAQA